MCDPEPPSMEDDVKGLLKAVEKAAAVLRTKPECSHLADELEEAAVAVSEWMERGGDPRRDGWVSDRGLP